MKSLKVLLVLIVVAVIGWLTWNYLAGPMKHQRDMQAFAASVEQCEPIVAEIYMPISGLSMAHTVDGMRDNRCQVRIETLGNHEIQCAFPVEDLPVIAQGFVDLANQVDIFGGTEFRVSTSDPDPLTQALNSEACVTVAK